MKLSNHRASRCMIGRRDLLLLMLGVPGQRTPGEGVGGITRLQKLLFLLEKEEHVIPSGEGFTFEAYKAGPYSSRLYDDLEFLENLGLIGRRVAAECAEREAVEAGILFEELAEPMREPCDALIATPDAYEECSFYLTPTGLQKIQHLLADDTYQSLVDSISRVKSRYRQYSLEDLLRHVAAIAAMEGWARG